MEWRSRVLRHATRVLTVEDVADQLSLKDNLRFITQLSESVDVDSRKAAKALPAKALVDSPIYDQRDDIEWLLLRALERRVQVDELFPSCPLPATANGRCPVHSDPRKYSVTDADVIDVINDNTDDQIQLLGARLDALALRRLAVLDDPDACVRLVLCDISGSVDLARCDIHLTVTFESCSLGRVDLRGSQLTSPVSIRHTQCRYVTASAATIADTLDIYRSNIERVSVEKSTITHRLTCRHSDVGVVRASSVSCDGVVSLYQSACSQIALTESTFGPDTTLGLEGVSGTSFVDLDRVTCDGSMRLTFTAPHETFVDARYSTIRDGVLDAAAGVKYDLTEATLGDVHLRRGSDLDIPLFDVFHVDQTTFDGFDFAKHRDAVAAQPNLHQFDHPATSTDDAPGLWGRFRSALRLPGNVQRLETTYLLAKRDAIEQGDGFAAAEFFRREMRYRRKGHLAKALGQVSTFNDRARGRWDARWLRTVALSKWIRSSAIGATTGYGERPSYVIGSTVTIVFAFALLYQQVFPRVTEGQFWDYLLFSFQTFITFILGKPPADTGYWVKWVTASEGFLGAFFIALFVFTLTRSIHR